MSSPFIFNVATLLHGGTSASMPVQRTQTGPTPVRIGPEMIAVPEGGQVSVDATLTPLGEGVLVDADVSARLAGQCARCLRELDRQLDVHVSRVFSASPDFITGEEDGEDHEGSGDEVPELIGDELDLLQTVIDEVVLTLPFSPTCEGGCPAEGSDVPAPDGVSGEEGERVDPRWSGLEKFL